MITKKIKNNKEKGFALLFSVLLSSIILAIALGISNIALKEINFTTSAKDTDDSFFAADAGAECALYNDKLGSFSGVDGSNNGTIPCLNHIITWPGDWYSPVGGWNFQLAGLGTSGKSCAIVNVTKADDGTGLIITTVTSKGYNNGAGTDGSSGSDTCTPTSKSVERELQVTF